MPHKGATFQEFYMKMINTHPYLFTVFINQLGS
jgi:hypothetical protein